MLKKHKVNEESNSDFSQIINPSRIIRQSLGLSVKDYITYIGTFLYVTYSGTFLYVLYVSRIIRHAVRVYVSRYVTAANSVRGFRVKFGV